MNSIFRIFISQQFENHVMVEFSRISSGLKVVTSSSQRSSTIACKSYHVPEPTCNYKNPIIVVTMSTSTSKRKKRLYSSLSCPSSPSLDSSRSSLSDDSDEDRPSKKLALSLNRLSLSNTPEPKEVKDVEMRQRKSYQKDAFTTVIESLSTTDSDKSDHEEKLADDASKQAGVADGTTEGMGEAPFSRDEAHVTILSEIEKRLTKFPHKLLRAEKDDDGKDKETALVLYRSPESMGLPVSERHKGEDMKALTRKRIIERRRRQRNGNVDVEADGYEADVEDFPSKAPLLHVNGAHHGPAHHIAGNGFVGNAGYQAQTGHVNSYGAPIAEDLDDDEDDMDGEMMELD